MAVASLLLSAAGTIACQICIPFPTKSAADYLVESDVVVLAREDPERAFHFAIIEVLKGALDGEKIDLFLDSSTRRHLLTHPDDSILIVKWSSEGSSDWQRIGLMDEAFGLVVRDTLHLARAWHSEPTDRAAYFAKRLDDKNSQIRTLAHLELARAPYSEIRKYGDVLTRETLLGFIGEMRYVEWHPLYILLLAQSDQPEDKALIRHSMESAVRFGTSLNLSAWATALLEIDQEDGVSFLERHYLGGPGRNAEEIRSISAALSVHGRYGTGALRDRIVVAYGVALDNHPELVPGIVTDLLAWQRYDLVDRVAAAALVRPPVYDPIIVLKLRAYAQGANSQSSVRP